MKSKSILYSLILLVCTYTAKAQPLLDRGYNFLLAVNSNGNDVGQSHYQVGNYMVKGNPYLFQSTIKVEFFQKGNSYRSNKATFNTYLQELEHNDEATKNVIAFDVTLLDSFYVNPIVDNNKTVNIGTKFINATYLETSKKFFVEELVKTDKIAIYKQHSCTLAGYGSGIQANAGNNPYREFKQESVYYYYTPTEKKLTKFTFKESKLTSIIGKYYDVSAGITPTNDQSLESALKDFMRGK
jgi:hypothetical protein